MTTEHTEASPAPVSRRRLLAAAGGAGVTVAALGAVGAVAAGNAYAGSARFPAAASSAEVDGPVVVHLRDLASGTVEVFRGTDRIQVNDHALAERIARVART